MVLIYQASATNLRARTGIGLQYMQRPVFIVERNAFRAGTSPFFTHAKNVSEFMEEAKNQLF